MPTSFGGKLTPPKLKLVWGLSVPWFPALDAFSTAAAVRNKCDDIDELEEKRQTIVKTRLFTRSIMYFRHRLVYVFLCGRFRSRLGL